MSKKRKNRKQATKPDVPEASPEPQIGKEELPLVAQDHMVDARMLALRHPEYGGKEEHSH
jgi:hypothetical protein